MLVHLTPATVVTVVMEMSKPRSHAHNHTASLLPSDDMCLQVFQERSQGIEFGNQVELEGGGAS